MRAFLLGTTGSVEDNKRSTLILKCKKLLLERSDKYDHMLQLKIVNRTLNY